ncbi:MAG: hypothetical protein M1816_000198 [Peltula sp. TS41687]|nr:MAG: hypothetical protein M1816_000198 [Peltula sp. TS41687]
MRSVAETFIRWHVLFTDHPTLSSLKKAVANGDDASPCISGLRSIFLLFGDFDPGAWQKTLSNSRSAYAALREHFLHNIEHPDEVNTVDPLADDQNSPWITLRQDEILRAEIYQDIERCMPENAYFREGRVQRILLDVLFIFCKLNPDIGYRQGMHELLAPVLWVVEKDAIQPKSLEKHRGSDGSGDGLLRDLLDAKYLEHDVFTLFSLVMQTARTFYELGDKDQGVNALQVGATISSPRESPIIERSRRIHHDYLARVDPELARRLTAMEILPQIFLIRWIRLLFGREFNFDQLLRLWDAFFAEDPALELVDLICVAMLLRVRWQLVRADYSSALGILLRYPTSASKSHGVSFVQDALYLKDNLTIEGGIHIILKHSGKSPASRKKSKRISSTKPTTIESQDRRRGSSKTRNPIESPARFIRKQGIDVLLQDAAKAVYQQGERWGVNKAVREAVDEVKRNMQNIQSTTSSSTSPRVAGGTDNIRWSLDEGRHIFSESASPTTVAPNSLETVEQRNRELGRILEGAVEGLKDLMSNLNKSREEKVEDGITMAALEQVVTKIGSVKECLHDSKLPTPKNDVIDDDSEDPSAAAAVSSEMQNPSDSIPASKLVDSTLGLETEIPKKDATTTAVATTETAERSASTVPSQSSPINIIASPTSPSSLQGSRPALAESSFAWMLGESELRSSFIASFPTPATERRHSRHGKSGYLFGNSTEEKSSALEDGERGDSLSLTSWSGGERTDE